MTRLGIMVSGRGSNMLAIMEACREKKLNAEVAIVISNNKESLALEHAQKAGIETAYLSSRTHADPQSLDKIIADTLHKHKIDLLILAGYMKMIGPITQASYHGKIINIHPSLLPRHGGKGMFGIHVHEAVIASGDKETGVTIHMVDGEYDEGAILAQSKIAVRPEDTPETLASRVLKLEHQLYSETIQGIIEGRIRTHT